jgi:hypothetical protein
MLHHHLHFLTRLPRHAAHLYQYAKATIDFGLVRLQDRSYRFRHPKSLTARNAPLLIHYHIFKNAGTSFEWTLEQTFGKRVRRYDSPIAAEVLSPKDIANYVKKTPQAEVICSHQATLPPPRIRGREVISSVLIRDPIARIRSIYAFERRQEATSPGARKAKELDFKEYVEWRLDTSPSMLCNFQVHFCSRTKKPSSEDLDGETLLRKAIANLDQIDLVGTVARYNDWLALTQVVLSRKFRDISLTVTRQNVTDLNTEALSETSILDGLVRDLGETLADHLLRANELDMSLHQVADALLTRRLAEHGVDIALRNAYADARKRLSPKVPESFSETA